MIQINDVKSFFELIAITLPDFGHSSVNNAFFGFNANEALSEEREDLAKTTMGMSLNTHSNLEGRYIRLADSVQNQLYVDVVFLEQTEPGDFNAVYASYDRMKRNMDSLMGFIFYYLLTGSCKYPVLNNLDVDSITFNRVGPVMGNYYGWKLRLKLKSTLTYNLNNPLNTLL